MNNPFAKKIAAFDFEGNTRQLSDNVLQSAEEAVETTRDLAHDTLSRADRKARDLRRSLDPAIDELAHRAQDYARRGKGLAIDASAKARQAVSQYADATSRYVADQPVKAVLIAAAAGAIIAALLVSRRNPPQR
jgi:ElaB/YqjD/DUF883 family membrane-anchored ribosome-binding protein